MNMKAQKARIENEILLRRPDVENITGLSRSSIYEQIQQGAFPKPIAISSNKVAWIETEILKWIESRIKIRNDNENEIFILKSERLLRRPEVENITGLSCSGIYAQVKQGTFPKPVAITNNTLAWVDSEIRQWIKDLIKIRDDNKR